MNGFLRLDTVMFRRYKKFLKPFSKPLLFVQKLKNLLKTTETPPFTCF